LQGREESRNSNRPPRRKASVKPSRGRRIQIADQKFAELGREIVWRHVQLKKERGGKRNDRASSMTSETRCREGGLAQPQKKSKNLFTFKQREKRGEKGNFRQSPSNS